MTVEVSTLTSGFSIWETQTIARSGRDNWVAIIRNDSISAAPDTSIIFINNSLYEGTITTNSLWWEIDGNDIATLYYRLNSNYSSQPVEITVSAYKFRPEYIAPE